MQQISLSPKASRSIAIFVFCLIVIFTLFQLPHETVSHFSPFDIYGKTQSQLQSSLSVDWSRFAYVQYVTNTAYLCNSIMLFETLHRLHSKPDRLMMYPSTFSIDERNNSIESRLLRKARDEYQVKLMPIEVQSRASGEVTWAESYTKLLAFNQTQYDRVLSLDSDSTTMDELFLLPKCPVAIPRAYWFNFEDRVMSSQLILIQPSEFEFNRVKKAIDEAGKDDYDMEIVNNLYKDSALIIPHRPYNLLTGEFRADNHVKYLGGDVEKWDPERALSEAKFLHFSDWPVPKPWIPTSPKTLEAKQPSCRKDPETGEEDCRERHMWLGFYADFVERREFVCNITVDNTRAKRDSSTEQFEPVALPHKYEYII